MNWERHQRIMWRLSLFSHLATLLAFGFILYLVVVR